MHMAVPNLWIPKFAPAKGSISTLSVCILVFIAQDFYVWFDGAGGGPKLVYVRPWIQGAQSDEDQGSHFEERSMLMDQ